MRQFLERHVGETVFLGVWDDEGIAVSRIDEQTVGVWLRRALHPDCDDSEDEEAAENNRAILQQVLIPDGVLTLPELNPEHVRHHKPMNIIEMYGEDGDVERIARQILVAGRVLLKVAVKEDAVPLLRSADPADRRLAIGLLGRLGGHA